MKKIVPIVFLSNMILSDCESRDLRITVEHEGQTIHRRSIIRIRNASVRSPTAANLQRRALARTNDTTNDSALMKSLPTEHDNDLTDLQQQEASDIGDDVVSAASIKKLENGIDVEALERILSTHNLRARSQQKDVSDKKEDRENEEDNNLRPGKPL